MQAFLAPAAFGFLAVFLGIGCGAVACYRMKRTPGAFVRAFSGFSGGLLLAFSCFVILPEAFGEGLFFSVVLAMLAGVACSVCYERRFADFLKGETAALCLNRRMPGIFLAALPEACLLGFLFCFSKLQAVRFLIVCLLHFGAGGFLYGVFLKKEGQSLWRGLCLLFLFCLPHGAAAALGGLVFRGPALLAVFLGFGGGLLLYATCGEILPEGLSKGEARLSALGGLVGFFSGVLLIYRG